MRWVFCTLLLLGIASPAAAADLDILRGSETVGPATFTRWSGFYVGGQVGYTNGNADFSSATQPGLAFALRQTTLEQQFAPNQWQVLGTGNTSAATYGAFVGYNSQWQDLTLGVEANFNRAGFTLHAPSTPIGPLITAADSQGFTHTVQVRGTGSVTNMDFATFRGTAGYVVGNFKPYAFGGLALAVSNVAITANVLDEQCPSAKPNCGDFFLFSSSFSRNSEVLYGFAVGGGVDVALAYDVFLRAEFEWDQFKPPPGILMTVATGRVGAGVKF